jgi:precorrin-2 dehydrogenase/sirohydrochlorin ferrochelatase
VLYPVFMDLRGRRCVIAGGGAVARRKAEGLSRCGARVVVVSPEISWRPRDGVVWRRRTFRPADVRGAALVFAATDDPAVNRAVARAARARGVPANVADAPAWCDFTLPSVFRRGKLTLAISTGGASPALARRLREDLGRSFGREYAAALAALEAFRVRLLRREPDAARRRRLLRAAGRIDLAGLVRRSGVSAARRRLAALLPSHARIGTSNVA